MDHWPSDKCKRRYCLAGIKNYAFANEYITLLLAFTHRHQLVLKYWKSLSFTTRFSIIAATVTCALGLLSMGALGAALYYTVSFLFSSFPSFSSWTGDWVWPAVISAGMFWSLGFIWAGLVAHFVKKIIASPLLRTILYIIMCWLWAVTVWYIILSVHF